MIIVIWLIFSNLRGLLFENISPQMTHFIGKQIELLIKNPELCKRFATNAREYVIENFRDKLINDSTYNAYLRSLKWFKVDKNIQINSKEN